MKPKIKESLIEENWKFTTSDVKPSHRTMDDDLYQLLNGDPTKKDTATTSHESTYSIEPEEKTLDNIKNGNTPNDSKDSSLVVSITHKAEESSTEIVGEPAKEHSADDFILV